MVNKSKSIIIKLKNSDKVFESIPSVYSRIIDLNNQIDLCNNEILLLTNKTDLIEKRIYLKEEINKLVLNNIKKELGKLYKVCRNAKPENRLPDQINIHNVFKNTIIFDFRVDKDFQDVIFNGQKLVEGNHFCILWIGDFMGFPDSERFITLYHYNIKSISPLIGEMYVYDSLWNGLKVNGVLFIQGEELLEPKYSTIEVVSEDLFRAYRINPNNEKDPEEKIIQEGWQYYNKYGKQVSDVFE